MKKSVHLISFIFLIGFINHACKKKTEPAPEVKFSLSAIQISEGDTVVFINETKNASAYEWQIPGLKFLSNEKSPSFVFTKAGTEYLTLRATNGDGVSVEKSMTLQILPDSVYRLSNHSNKLWIVKSLVYGGSEVLVDACQKDDEFTVVYGKKDTCLMTEGVSKCPSGTYAIELPTSSLWRFNSKTKAFEFALVALGTPLNLSFVTSELTHTTFKGKDVTNDVFIHLEAK